jgi:hypothetical protein
MVVFPSVVLIRRSWIPGHRAGAQCMAAAQHGRARRGMRLKGGIPATFRRYCFLYISDIYQDYDAIGRPGMAITIIFDVRNEIY